MPTNRSCLIIVQQEGVQSFLYAHKAVINTCIYHSCFSFQNILFYEIIQNSEKIISGCKEIISAVIDFRCVKCEQIGMNEVSGPKQTETY